MLYSDEASRHAACSLFDELHSALAEDPLPKRVASKRELIDHKYPHNDGKIN